MFFMSSTSDSTRGGGTTSEDFASSPGISNRSSKNFGLWSGSWWALGGSTKSQKAAFMALFWSILTAASYHASGSRLLGRLAAIVATTSPISSRVLVWILLQWSLDLCILIPKLGLRSCPSNHLHCGCLGSMFALPEYSWQPHLHGVGKIHCGRQSRSDSNLQNSLHQHCPAIPPTGKSCLPIFVHNLGTCTSWPIVFWFVHPETGQVVAGRRLDRRLWKPVHVAGSHRILVGALVLRLTLTNTHTHALIGQAFSRLSFGMSRGFRITIYCKTSYGRSSIRRTES